MTASYNDGHNILEFFYISVKFGVATSRTKPFISNLTAIHELPHELPNDLILRILGNKEISGRPSKPLQIQTRTQSPSIS